MRALERPFVSEIAAVPSDRVVAEFAVRGEVGIPVIGLGCTIVLGSVATDTVLAGSLVVAPLVAVLADAACMRTAERPLVAEVGATPTRGLMADGAIERVAGSSVVGSPRAIIIVLVTTHAVLLRRLVVANAVASLACQGQMGTRQRPTMPEVPTLPSLATMALATVVGKASLEVIWIGGVPELGSVATRAILAESDELTVLVTVRTLRGSVFPGQREEGVHEASGAPSRWTVAALTIRSPAVHPVIGTLGSRQVILVAREAVRARPFELTDLGARVAGPASDTCVCSDEGESSHRVLGDYILGLPGPFVVTGAAIGAQLPPVEILMTTATSPGRERLHRSPVIVAPKAFCLLVRSVERQACLLLVIELEVLSDVVPALSLVADPAIIRKSVMRDDGPMIRVPRIDRQRVRAAQRLPEDRAGQGEGDEYEEQTDLGDGGLVPGGNVVHGSEPSLDVETETQSVLVVAEAVVDVENEVGCGEEIPIHASGEGLEDGVFILDGLGIVGVARDFVADAPVGLERVSAEREASAQAVVGATLGPENVESQSALVEQEI
jgi:hypothetical protein